VALKKAVELDPKVATTWNLLGESQLLNHEYDDAIGSFTKSIDLAELRDAVVETGAYL